MDWRDLRAFQERPLQKATWGCRDGMDSGEIEEIKSIGVDDGLVLGCKGEGSIQDDGRFWLVHLSERWAKLHGEGWV